MIAYKTGDIFQSKAQILVDPVNCCYAAGGLAGVFKRRWPSMYEIYKKLCSTRELAIGKPVLYIASLPFILLFPVKYTWREEYAKLEDIEAGLKGTIELLHQIGFQETIAFPALGCGRGKLDWEDVQPLLDQYLTCQPYSVEVYKPY